jgi:hypothetical protein
VGSEETFISFFAFLPVLAMSASHLNKSPLLGNNLLEGKCTAKERMHSTEYRILNDGLGLLHGICQAITKIVSKTGLFLKGVYK